MDIFAIAEISKEKNEIATCQFSTASLNRMVFDWIQKIQPDEIGLGDRGRRILFEEDQFDHDPTALEGLQGVWCETFSVNEDFVIVNFFRKIKSALEIHNYNKFIYTYCVLYGGGVYISQYQDAESLNSDITWANDGSWAISMQPEELNLLQKKLLSREIEFLKFDSVVGVSRLYLKFEKGDFIAFRIMQVVV